MDYRVEVMVPPHPDFPVLFIVLQLISEAASIQNGLMTRVSALSALSARLIARHDPPALSKRECALALPSFAFESKKERGAAA